MLSCSERSKGVISSVTGASLAGSNPADSTIIQLKNIFSSSVVAVNRINY